jgi:hypothetical protein
MSALEAVTPAHLARQAIIYVRQSSPHQALSNQESLKLQYALKRRAAECGWKPTQVEIIDSDLGQTGSTTEGRPGFKDLVTQVALGHVGIIFSYDVTRLSRNCSDWYQLLDLCSHRQCLVGDCSTKPLAASWPWLFPSAWSVTRPAWSPSTPTAKSRAGSTCSSRPSIG